MAHGFHASGPGFRVSCEPRSPGLTLRRLSRLLSLYSGRAIRSRQYLLPYLLVGRRGRRRRRKKA